MNKKWNPRANGVMNDIKNGNIIDASHKLNGTWVSLPSGKDDKMNDEQFMKTFKDFVSKELKSETIIDTPRGELIK